MKNPPSILVGIMFVIVMFVGFNPDLFVKWSNNRKERSYYNNAHEIASSRLNEITYDYFDRNTNEMLALKARAQANSWSLTRQEGFSPIETGDPNIPFIASGEYIFTNPENENHRHYLRDTYIFDYNHAEWVPLYSSLWEFKDGKSQQMTGYSLWQGDYEIPFFDK